MLTEFRVCCFTFRGRGRERCVTDIPVGTTERSTQNGKSHHRAVEKQTSRMLTLHARRQDVTQRMMLATWLVEIYLSKCNTLEDIIAAEAATSDVDSLRTELMLMEEDLRTFLTTYKVRHVRSVSVPSLIVSKWIFVMMVGRPIWMQRSFTN